MTHTKTRTLMALIALYVVGVISGAMAVAAQPSQTTGTISSEGVLKFPPAQFLTIGGTRIDLQTGAVTYPDTLEGRAREFWIAVSQAYPSVKKEICR